MIKNNKGITIVALVVTIIILIILAGISINMALGEAGIITIAKKAKENMELAQIDEQIKLNELYSQLENNGITNEEINYDTIAKLNNFKKQIADYIEEAGGIKPDYTDSAEAFGERIKGIVAEVTKDATAKEEDILEGKTAWVNGELITGTNSNLIQINQMNQLWQTTSQSGGTMNINYTTISYTFKENDFNQNYNFFLLNISNSGAYNVSHCAIDKVNIPEGSLSYHHIASLSPSGVSDANKLCHVESFICLIPTKNIKSGDTISIVIKGVYNIYIAGIN